MAEKERDRIVAEEDARDAEDGGPGEGIVIKRYGDWRNRYGNVLWAKMVRDEYKASAHVSKRSVAVKNGMEKTLADEFITKAYCEKELDKTKANGGWNEKMIPRLLGSIVPFADGTQVIPYSHRTKERIIRCKDCEIWDHTCGQCKLTGYPTDSGDFCSFATMKEES